MVISRTGYLISYSNCLITWASRIQTEIAIITMKADYVALSQSMRGVLPFVSLMKKIECVLKLQGDDLVVLCSLFEKPVMPVTFYRDNKGAIALVVSLQM